MGLLLAIFLFLPLGSCERKQVAKPTESSEVSIYKDDVKDINNQSLSKSDKKYLIVIKDVSLKEPSTWGSLFVFLWCCDSDDDQNGNDTDNDLVTITDMGTSGMKLDTPQLVVVFLSMEIDLQQGI